MTRRDSAHERTEGPIGRRFGYTFAAIVVGIAADGYGKGIGGWAVVLVVTALFALSSLVFPRALHSLNVAWLEFGLLLLKLLNPLVMAAMSVVAFVPMGTLLRILGMDALHLELDTEADSCWEK